MRETTSVPDRLSIEVLRRGPGAARAIVFVPPHGGEMTFYESPHATSPKGASVRHGEVVDVTRDPACGSEQTGISIGGRAGFLRAPFLLRDYELASASTGLHLLVHRFGAGIPDCPDAPRDARAHAIAPSGEIVDSSSSTAFAALFDARRGVFVGPIDARRGKDARGLVLFDGEGLVSEHSSGEVACLVRGRDGDELLARRGSDGTVVRYFADADGLRMDELPGTESSDLSPPALDPDGHRLVVGRGRETPARFHRDARTSYAVIVLESPDAAAARASADEFSARLGDRPLVRPGWAYPPTPRESFAVVALETTSLGKAEVARGRFAAAGVPGRVVAVRRPYWRRD